jgi:phospholipase C
MNRRRFTQGLFAGGLSSFAITMACRTPVPTYPLPPPGPLPNPAAVNPQDSGIDNIIVVAMENRSFDHVLGWLKGADGIPAGSKYLDTSGIAHNVYPLATTPDADIPFPTIPMERPI